MQSLHFSCFLQGITIKGENWERKYTGYLLVYLGDTPAAGVASGFKEGVGGANRFCRTCMINKVDICQKVS